MAINVSTNVSAMTAQRYLNSAAEGTQKSMERLSSGYKINSAKDDAAGLQISNRLTSQSRGLDMAGSRFGLIIEWAMKNCIKSSPSFISNIYPKSLNTL